ncbi:MAG TPA: cytidine deaminase [Acidobacteriota bacterium]|jgi:cytidine deaminase|nr:cytidine deaminase [Acidobacteriota bacterium]
MDLEKLKEAALKARDFAHAPYSNFRVGAALLDQSGVITTGCNVENATYGLTICAERLAIFKAISEGKKKFQALAVAADSEILAPPCGACRQIIWEFCGDIPVYLVNVRGGEKMFQMSQLFPDPFDDRQLT